MKSPCYPLIKKTLKINFVLFSPFPSPPLSLLLGQSATQLQLFSFLSRRRISFTVADRSGICGGQFVCDVQDSPSEMRQEMRIGRIFSSL